MIKFGLDARTELSQEKDLKQSKDDTINTNSKNNGKEHGKLEETINIFQQIFVYFVLNQNLQSNFLSIDY